jgi:hypothetical protein
MIGGACSMGNRDEKSVYNFSSRPLERPGRWWEDAIKIDIKEIRYHMN